MEKILQIYDNNGRSVIKVRTQLRDEESNLKAKLFNHLPAEKRTNLDLRGINFTGMRLEGISNCRLEQANLTAANVIDAENCSFDYATCIATTFSGNCANCTFDGTNMVGIRLDTPDIIIGGYFENGDMLVVNQRLGGWWVSTTYEGRSLYYNLEDASTVAFVLSDENYNRQITGLISNAVAKIRAVQNSKDAMSMRNMEQDVASLRQRMSSQSEVVRNVQVMTDSAPGDVLNQPTH